MRNPFAHLFGGLTSEKGSDNNDKHIRSYKVDKAVNFLSLPEIQNIDAFNTKRKFLKTRGLNEDEIKEAFRQLGMKSSVPQVSLNEIANEMVPVGEGVSTITLHRRETSSFSSFLFFCQKLLMVAGIATSCFYLYKQWLAIRTKLDQSKKEDANIRMELRQIKVELLRISGDLKNYNAVQENQKKLLAEVNSLKAILTSRQYFEEKKTTKSAIPAWQLNTAVQNGTTSLDATTKESPIVVEVESSQTNGHVDGVEPKTIPRKSKPHISSTEKAVIEEVIDSQQECVTHGACKIEDEKVRNVGESTLKSSIERKRDRKKNDKKNSSN